MREITSERFWFHDHLNIYLFYNVQLYFSLDRDHSKGREVYGL